MPASKAELKAIFEQFWRPASTRGVRVLTRREKRIKAREAARARKKAAKNA